MMADVSQTRLLRLSRHAMACRFEVLSPPETITDLQTAYEALDVVDDVEDMLSVYREDSALSRLNRQASKGPTRVVSDLFALLQEARRLWKETDGCFDITIGPLIACWGFSHREGRIPSLSELKRALDKIGTQFLDLNTADLSVSFTRDEMSLNLGAIGKGYALDCAKRKLCASGIDTSINHGGYSSILAWGKEPHQNGWSVGIRHPLIPGRRLAKVELLNQGLSTSGSGEQFFRAQGKRFCHLLDPRSGFPVEGMLSVTAIAPSAAEADALSTAFFNLGVEKVARYCDNHPEVAAVVIPHPVGGGNLRVVPLGSALRGFEMEEHQGVEVIETPLRI